MPESGFDPQLSADLHNRILHHAWTGAGRGILPSITWWEESSPVPFDTVSRLNPKLIQFLRLAQSTYSEHQSFSPENPGFHFFYFLDGLQMSSHMLRFSCLEIWGDRFVYLYSSVCANNDDEVGIVFDQETELAAYLAHWDDIHDFCRQPWPWKPLQDILRAYLEMIEEGKVKTSLKFEKEQTTPQFFPWEYHQYTQRDIEKAIAAFTRLLDAIEHRLPQVAARRNLKRRLPYSHSALDEATIPVNSFIRSFLSMLPPRHLQFRHIAPGISVQSPTEFIAQPFKEPPNDESGGHKVPFRLFRGDGSAPSTCRPPYFPDPESGVKDLPTGLYVNATGEFSAADFGNTCRLLLPFGIGARRCARFSSGQLLLEDVADELYQPGRYSGFLEYHEVQLHKVLLNWAERVEAGDWEVDADGVAGGIEKFKEADTPEHWKKYQVPLSW